MAAKHQVKRPVSAKELAQQFGVTERSVRNVMAQPRQQWLAEHTTSRQRPWTVLGISRSTWYRYGKPTPPQQ